MQADVKVGKPFDPRWQVCGFRPAEVVSRDRTIRREDGKRLNAAQKHLYQRIINWCGKNGCCWYKVETMADEMGRCIRSVKGDLAALIEVGLVASKRQGPGPAIYRPLYHPMFRRKEVQDPAPQADTDISEQAGKKCKPTPKEVQNSAGGTQRKSAPSATQLAKSIGRGHAESLRIRAEIVAWAAENLIEVEKGEVEARNVYNRWLRHRHQKDGLINLFRLVPEINRSWFGRFLRGAFPGMQSCRSLETGRQNYVGIMLK